MRAFVYTKHVLTFAIVLIAATLIFAASPLRAFAWGWDDYDSGGGWGDDYSSYESASDWGAIDNVTSYDSSSLFDSDFTFSDVSDTSDVLSTGSDVGDMFEMGDLFSADQGLEYGDVMSADELMGLGEYGDVMPFDDLGGLGEYGDAMNFNEFTDLGFPGENGLELPFPDDTGAFDVGDILDAADTARDLNDLYERFFPDEDGETNTSLPGTDSLPTDLPIDLPVDLPIDIPIDLPGGDNPLTDGFELPRPDFDLDVPFIDDITDVIDGVLRDLLDGNLLETLSNTFSQLIANAYEQCSSLGEVTNPLGDTGGVDVPDNLEDYYDRLTEGLDGLTSTNGDPIIIADFDDLSPDQLEALTEIAGTLDQTGSGEPAANTSQEDSPLSFDDIMDAYNTASDVADVVDTVDSITGVSDDILNVESSVNVSDVTNTVDIGDSVINNDLWNSDSGDSGGGWSDWW